MKFIAYTTCAANNARPSEYIPYGPTNMNSTANPAMVERPVGDERRRELGVLRRRVARQQLRRDRRRLAGVEGVTDGVSPDALTEMTTAGEARGPHVAEPCRRAPRPLVAARDPGGRLPGRLLPRAARRDVRRAASPTRSAPGCRTTQQFFAEAAYVRVLLNTFWIAVLATAGLPRDRLPVRLPDVDRARAVGRAAAHRGAAAVLVEPAGADVRLAGAAARHRRHQPLPARPRPHLRAADAHPHDGRRHRRDVAHPAAVHGPADLRGDAPDRPGVRPRRGEPRRVAVRGVHPRSSSRSACRASSPAACSSSSWRSASTSRRRCSAGCATR